MDKALYESLKNAGTDVDAALERVMGNEALFLRLLKKFSADTNFEELKKALSDGETETAFAKAHSLKGMTGNLSMTGLYELFSRQTEFLRGGDLSSGVSLMPEIEPLYEKIRDIVSAI